MTTLNDHDRLIYRDWFFASSEPSSLSRMIHVINTGKKTQEEQDRLKSMAINSDDINPFLDLNIEYSFSRQFFARKKITLPSNLI